LPAPRSPILVLMLGAPIFAGQMTENGFLSECDSNETDVFVK